MEPSQIERTYTRADLMQALGGICAATLRKYVKTGKVPAPDANLSRRTQTWIRSSLLRANIRLD